MPSRWTTSRRKKENALAETKQRKKPVRTPASQLMLTLAAMERAVKKLPADQQAKAVKMFNALMEEPPLFVEATK